MLTEGAHTEYCALLANDYVQDEKYFPALICVLLGLKAFKSCQGRDCNTYFSL